MANAQVVAELRTTKNRYSCVYLNRVLISHQCMNAGHRPQALDSAWAGSSVGSSNTSRRAPGMASDGEPAQAFNLGTGAAPRPRARPGPRPGAKPKCPGRPERKRRDRGHGTDAPKRCKGKILACCGYCKLHCECAPADTGATEGCDDGGTVRKTPSASSRRESVPFTPVDGVASWWATSQSDENNEAAERDFQRSMTWDAEGFEGKIPLSSIGASIGDVRDYFGFGKSFGNHGMGIKRKTGEELLAAERARQSKVLDETSEVIAKILNRQNPTEVEGILQDWHAEHTQLLAQREETEERALLENAVLMLEAVPNHCEAGVALRALLTKSIGVARLKRLTHKHTVRFTKEGNADFDMILRHHTVPERRATRKRTSDNIVRRTVRWLLSPDNVAMLSWGRKTARLDGEKIDIPCVSRKRDKSTMWCEYKAQFENKKERLGDKIGRASCRERV